MHHIVLWVVGVILGGIGVTLYHRHNDYHGEQVVIVWYGLCWIVSFYGIGFWLIGWWTVPVTTVGLYGWSKTLDWRARRSVKKREREQ